VRSKPDPVDQPERTAHYDCEMCIAEMLHNTETVRLIFPFLQTNITVQMVRGVTVVRTVKQCTVAEHQLHHYR